jgi:hypothetical protein
MGIRRGDLFRNRDLDHGPRGPLQACAVAGEDVFGDAVIDLEGRRAQQSGGR